MTIIHPLKSELKQVFDGSCRLIPVKVIADECITLSDQFIVQLVDTLSSEMNPQVVCAVAGESIHLSLYKALPARI